MVMIMTVHLPHSYFCPYEPTVLFETWAQIIENYLLAIHGEEKGLLHYFTSFKQKQRGHASARTTHDSKGMMKITEHNWVKNRSLWDTTHQHS